MENKIKAASYVRVSTQAQVQEGESLATQKEQIQQFIASKGWELVKEYSDEGLSGAKSESRPGLQQLLKDAKEGMFSNVVFTKLSRFARNARDYQNISFELEKSGVQIVSIKEGLDKSTQTGRLIAGILALFAEWEHETIREQMAENKMSRWRENRSFVGKPPFGYQWNKEKKQLEVVPDEADLYRRIVNMYINQGMPMRDIAIKLNSEGLKLKRSTFNGAVISYILKNSAYYGSYIVNRHIYGDSSRGAGTKRTKELKPESEAITFPIPALISKTEWDLIQEATQRNKVKSKHKGEFTDSFFLRNVCKCEVCGGKMNARIGNKRQDGSVLRYYNCYWAGTSKKNIEGGRHHKCSLPNVPADIVEREVWNRVLMLFTYSPKETAILYSDNDLTTLIKDAEKAIESLQKDVQTKKKARERLYRLTEAENCDLDELTKKLRINKDELITLESRLADQENRLKELDESKQKVTERNEFMQSNKQNLKILRQEINSLEPVDKKILVEALLVGPVTVGIREADPDHPEDGAGFVVDFRLRFNPDILNRFKSEGKILKLNSDSRDYSNLIRYLSIH